MIAVRVCPHCGGPMESQSAIVCAGDGIGDRLTLPPHCTSKECQEARDEAALARAVESGLIDP